MPGTDVQLRDIHLPPAIGWWPPAIGWWLLLLGVGMACLFAYRRFRRAKPDLSPKSAALSDLQRIEREFQSSGDTQRLVAEISGLLRRVAMTYCERDRVAGLTGQAWLERLDRLFKVREFSSGAGQVLASGPYVRLAEVDSEGLLALCHTVINQLPATATQGPEP